MTEETKPATKTHRKATRKMIVIQMEMFSQRDQMEGPPIKTKLWKDMTGADFGDDNPSGLVRDFGDTAEAIRRLRQALESGRLSGGTFRVAVCDESFTPTVEQQQTNKVTM